MSRIKKWLSLIILSAFFLGSILPVYADEIDDARSQLQEVGQQINNQQGKLNSVKKQEKTIMGQLQTIEKNIITRENEIKTLEGKIEYLHTNIAVTEDDIELAEAELEEKNQLLSERLVYIYEKGDLTYLEVLLSATDIKDFITRYEMVNMIVEQDLELIDSINQQKHTLNTKKSDLLVEKNELVYAQDSEKTKREELSEQKQDKKTVLNSVQKEKAQYEKALAELEQTSNELEATIRRIQSGTSGEQLGTGVFTWPAPGYSTITSPYGMRYHPILKYNKMHTGVDIGAPSGADIVAADSGTVIQTGWLGGYGQVVVIDHGGGISTLYAHMSTIIAANGASVTKGQVIGKVGSTGWSTGPHLHFEVRINGAYTDPMSYI
ncbi:MAG TPA: peptidoglycan DD-metalloendopeptidase family protein [Syntrophomonadaceae bacterium]|nr:peptidoglycan DD-metalloendopeptidase family protein [Syntrophomonadaceae bacterium]HNX29401.1 peptidoglycan DD-metalloendopeptidase family protein [Syntrophomonadaceae bacterium]HPR93863.1 peptidoglycan DD-metalloendopeptidase family protein [Syntrophomonadaceae bacterium]